MNELSLDGQFESLQLFLTSLRSTVKLQKILESSNTSLLRHHELYNRRITSQLTLHQVLTNNSIRTSSEIRVFKVLLQKLMYEEPFWTSSPKHSSNDKYICLNVDSPNGHSLAEACERDRVIVSFQHPSFQNEIVEVIKNGVPITLINIISPITLVVFLWESRIIINPAVYCHYKYGGSKLSFDLLEEEYGFDILEPDEIKAFLSSFETFTELSWDDIGRSDGLQYKPYSPNSKQNDWFRNSSHQEKSIYKFRTSKKYRCFGYRANDIFYVLRFERDHEVSNRG